MSDSARVRTDRRNHGIRKVSIAVVALALTLMMPLFGQQYQSRRHQRRRAQHASAKRKGLDVSRINDPDTRDAIGPHSEGEAVVRAAILLNRLKFSPGEITGSYDDNLAKAIAAFRLRTACRQSELWIRRLGRR